MAGLSTDHAAAALVYTAGDAFNWAQALTVPFLQATANILVIEKQKDLYDLITLEQRALLDVAVTNYVQCVDNVLPLYEGAYPDIPEAAEYVPVDPCQEQRCTIECNISLIGLSDAYVQCINRLHEQNDLTRAVSMDPRYLVNIDIYSMTVQDLLRGHLPVGDVMEVMTDTAEQSCLQGRIGGCRQMTMRNLGLSKLRANREGRKAMQEQLAMINRDVSPVSRQHDITEMMQSPAQRISLALQQAQLIQNSLQNLYNRNAQKPPHLLAELQTKMDRCINKLQLEAQKASLVNQFVPNYSAILQPMIRDLANGIGGTMNGIARRVGDSYSTPSEGGGKSTGVNATRDK
jgi:hypothetical protein